MTRIFVLRSGVLILAVLAANIFSWAETGPALSTIAVTAESIPSGVILHFEPSSEMRSRLDHFRLWRSTDASAAFELSTGTSIKLDYYHDWFKDYFQASDLHSVFCYRLRAYDNENKTLARGLPDPVSWEIKEIPAQGLMLVPSAYRKIPLYDTESYGVGRLLPINIDITTVYFIGRIYGYNNLEDLTNTRSILFTRLGVWFIQGDAKVILEKETKYFPQLAVGVEGANLLRDSKQPEIQNPTFAFNFQKENSRRFVGLFTAASKQFGPIQTTLGYVQGSTPAKMIYLTEFLPAASQPEVGVFGGLTIQATRNFSFQTEFISALKTEERPLLINLKLGSKAHTNFDIGYLSYTGGYEVLAHFSFRYTLYPQLTRK
ncbi:MAG: hypothetical protein HY547_02610 [Elusimicrobia bacterium]|nr:hypothetical protein [Elusimicrobiota bacterium]